MSLKDLEGGNVLFYNPVEKSWEMPNFRNSPLIQVQVSLSFSCVAERQVDGDATNLGERISSSSLKSSVFSGFLTDFANLHVRHFRNPD